MNKKKLFCCIGRHWMKNHKPYFIDSSSDKQVYVADCECGKKWMVDSLFPLWGFRVRIDKKDEK